MKVTGYKIQQALRRHKNCQEIAYKQFEASVTFFPSDTKPDLDNLFKEYIIHEKAIAQLQVVQAQYNLNVFWTDETTGIQMTLHEAVKLVGGAGRAEKMWRVAAKGGKDNDRYGFNSNMRDKNNEYAAPTLTAAECLKRANQAAKVASQLREAIQIGNAKEVELNGFDPSLFD